MSNRWPVLRGRVATARAALARFRNLEREQSLRPALAFILGLLLRGWDSLRTVPGIRARSQTLAAVAVTLALAAVVLAELQSSMAVSVVLPPLAERMRSVVGPGPNRQVRFPAQGPYDQRLGYSSLPGFIAALGSRGWDVALQARPSGLLRAWIDATGHAVYREKTVSGLTLLDRRGAPLYQARFPGRIFGDASEIPPLLTATLLRIEDRHLLDQGRPRRNPAVDWPRFLLAIAGHVRQGSHAGAGGASTLATQIEKFRHSPQGRTEDYAEKLRQMATASLRIYAGGGDTTEARRQLVATYLDSVPLSSRAGYGEVIGLGDGLWAWYGIDFDRARYALALPQEDPRQLAALADAYKHALSLLLAERRPTYYLVAHHAALETLTNRYLRLLADQGVITPRLRDAALGVGLRFGADPPAAVDPPFAERKGVDALRVELLQQLQLPGLNSLDRLDLAAQSTIDDRAQRAVSSLLQGLADPAYAASLGLVGPELLPAKRLDQVVYSVLVYERTAAGNELRVHADNLNQPFDVNSGAKLILGSTAKLRT
ncbi:MAG TPA: transglycosylase domain-containing protein, partial [Nevskia sp.]|nr:transglycosylase domain-containing protein [Nevskia sp.]